MQSLTLLGKAFSEPVRVRVIALLMEGELCVCELCDVLELPQSTLSTHLQFLRQTGLVNTRQEGRWVYYTLGPTLHDAALAWFALGKPVTSSDSALKTDMRKLKQRLAKRDDEGACCVGFGRDRRTSVAASSRTAACAV